MARLTSIVLAMLAIVGCGGKVETAADAADDVGSVGDVSDASTADAETFDGSSCPGPVTYSCTEHPGEVCEERSCCGGKVCEGKCTDGVCRCGSVVNGCDLAIGSFCCEFPAGTSCSVRFECVGLGH